MHTRRRSDSFCGHLHHHAKGCTPNYGTAPFGPKQSPSCWRLASELSRRREGSAGRPTTTISPSASPLRSRLLPGRVPKLPLCGVSGDMNLSGGRPTPLAACSRRYWTCVRFNIWPLARRNKGCKASGPWQAKPLRASSLNARNADTTHRSFTPDMYMVLHVPKASWSVFVFRNWMVTK